MCTYRTEIIETKGSGKGTLTWTTVDEATVYFDHPVHAPFAHSINIDFRNTALTNGERIALELEPKSALKMAQTILQLLKDTPIEITELDNVIA
ncbi:MAG: DUF6295 family protein [Firmicutes bacterium]|nr:DUF6295 family protein [Bacillota bacterium]